MTKPPIGSPHAALAAFAAFASRVLASTPFYAGLIILAFIQNLLLSIMGWQLRCILFTLLGLVQSITSSGRRLLVVLEEVEKKYDYSDLWADLRGAVGFGHKKSVRADIRTELRARFHAHLRISEERSSCALPTWGASLRSCYAVPPQIERYFSQSAKGL